MGLLQSLAKKFKGDPEGFKAQLKEAQLQDKVETTLQERKMSSNERELIAYNKKMREDDIKKEVDKIHKQQTKESWNPKHKILDKGKSILKSDKNIMSGKITNNKNNMFLGNKSLFLKKGKLC